MAKDKSSIPAFFWHMLSEVAINLGWDMVDDEAMYTLLQPHHNEVMFSLKGREGTAVTVADLVELSKGDLDNANFKTFAAGLLELVKNDKDTELKDTEPLMVSMHSGSSDYFTYEMLKDYVGA